MGSFKLEASLGYMVSACLKEPKGRGEGRETTYLNTMCYSRLEFEIEKIKSGSLLTPAHITVGCGFVRRQGASEGGKGLCTVASKSL